MLKYFFQLLKFRLSITVVFSAMVGYLLGFDDFNGRDFIYLTIGGFLVTGSANAFNQILEKDKDIIQDAISQVLNQKIQLVLSYNISVQKNNKMPK